MDGGEQCRLWLIGNSEILRLMQLIIIANVDLFFFQWFDIEESDWGDCTDNFYVTSFYLIQLIALTRDLVSEQPDLHRPKPRNLLWNLHKCL